jgi:hypothetical protein
MLNDLEVVWDEEGASLSEPTAVSLKDAAETDNDEDEDGSDAVKQKKGTTFSKGGITYQITNNKINGKGCVSVIKVKNSKKITIKNKITYQGAGYRITKIGKNAFSKCKKLTQLTLGTSISAVGKNALAQLPENCVIRVPKKKLAAYRKLLKNAGLKKTVKIVTLAK